MPQLLLASTVSGHANTKRNTMTEIPQRHIGSLPEDIEDVLIKIERSYDIRFAPNELAYIVTFGQLCDHIISKIDLHDTDDCTSQQSFYKLREAISAITQTNKSAINSKTVFSTIFPRLGRREMINELKNNLGIDINLLRPKYFISWAILMAILISIIDLFFNWKLGLFGIASFILLYKIAELTGNEFKINSVGELATIIGEENYSKARRNPETVNKKEITKKIEKLFIRELGLGERFQTIEPNTIIIDR